MANIKISDMTRATSVGGSDLLPIVQGGESKSIEYKKINKYSTTEQVVGTWTNGKPLYECVCTGTTPTVTADGTSVGVDFDLSADKVDFCFVVSAFVDVRGNELYLGNAIL